MSRLGFAKLFVSDLDGMGDFCRSALGASEVARIALDDMDEILLSLAGGEPDLVLMRLRQPVPGDAGTLYGPVGVIVDDCAATAEQVVAAGGELKMAPVKVEAAAAVVAFVASPEGHQFELVQPLS